MQRNIFLKSIAIFLSVYLPLITVGLPLHKHYCGGNLENSQWLIGVDSCHESAEKDVASSCCSIESSCHSTNSSESEEKDCCEDEVEIFKSEISFVFQNPSLEDLETAATLLHANIDYNSSLYAKSKSFSPVKIKYFHPYPNGQSVIVRHQQFLC